MIDSSNNFYNFKLIGFYRKSNFLQIDVVKSGCRGLVEAVEDKRSRVWAISIGYGGRWIEVFFVGPSHRTQ
jgi:hypothetical protein